MQKTALRLAIFVVVVSLLGLILPRSSGLAGFLPGRTTSLICLLLVPLMSFLTIMTYFEEDLSATLLDVFGAVLCIVAILGLATPTFFGMVYYYSQTPDLLTVLVLGIAYAIVGLETPHESALKQLTWHRHRLRSKRRIRPILLSATERTMSHTDFREKRPLPVD